MPGSVAVPFTLVSSARTGFTSVLGQTTDPYDDPAAPDYAPSIVWHWRATVPATIADWIVMYSSIVLHVAGPTLGGALDFVDRGYFYDGNPVPADGDGYGAMPQVYLNAPVAQQDGPWFLFDQPSGTPSNWEELWLTECLTAGPAPAYNQNARSGPQFYWADPQWRASINNHNGFLSYLVPPFPTTVDYWLVTPSYWASNGRKIDASYVVLDSRLIIISCQPTSTVAGVVDMPGLLCHDGPLGVGVGGPVQNRYSLRDLVYLAASVGCFANVPVAASVAMAESGGDPLAQGDDADGSVDRGLWQINSLAHPDVSDVCAFNPVCNAKAACTISNGGTDWTPWVTYNTGAYLTYLAAATAIFNAMG